MVVKVAKGLFVTSPDIYTGKTIVTLGLALYAKEERAKISYMKPIGWAGTTIEGKPMDEDVVLMKSILDLPHPYDVLCPIVVDMHFVEKLLKMGAQGMELIAKSYDQVQGDYDYVLLGGLRDTKMGLSAGLSAPEIAARLNANILLVVKALSDEFVDKVLADKKLIEMLGAKLQGVVLNFVPYYLQHHIREDVAPLLENKGIKIYGVIPEIPGLLNPTVREIAEELRGEILTATDKIDATYDMILVGAMGCESALMYARRSANKLVIVGGDRSDIILSVLETPTVALVLTGGIYPGSRVIAKAEEKGVPLILVSYDTYTTVQLIHKISGRIKPQDTKRINMVKENVPKYVDYKAILDDLKVD
ncbi:MAG: hypothetical protein DRJ60_06505 [Thermoprotei archaeon]|nr:MAG: hypothetical protein DRJ60_06505 [Thermoprotei archaeon]